jgi:hypothetical protein
MDASFHVVLPALVSPFPYFLVRNKLDLQFPCVYGWEYLICIYIRFSTFFRCAALRISEMNVGGGGIRKEYGTKRTALKMSEHSRNWGGGEEKPVCRFEAAGMLLELDL